MNASILLSELRFIDFSYFDILKSSKLWGLPENIKIHVSYLVFGTLEIEIQLLFRAHLNKVYTVQVAGGHHWRQHRDLLSNKRRPMVLRNCPFRPLHVDTISECLSTVQACPAEYCVHYIVWPCRTPHRIYKATLRPQV